MTFESPLPDYDEPETDYDQLRIPPHSVQAEQSVIGGLMLDNSTWDQVADRVGPEDFYRREHQLIFGVIRILADEQKPFDVVTLAEELERREELDDVGGLPYLAALAEDTPSAANIRAYADIVREHSVTRQLIRVGTEIAESGFRPEGRKVAELLDEAENKVFQIAEQRNREGEGFQPIKGLLARAIDRIEELQSSDEPLTGVSSGFDDFDNMTSGLQPSDLIIVAGRPSMGKCIVAGSRVLDPTTGRLEVIDDLIARRQGHLVTMNAQYRFQIARPSRFVDDGIKPVFRVRTALGREISTTLTHPFFTVDGWKRLKELRPGDRIGVPRQLPFFGQGTLSESRTKLVAYFLSDGALTSSCPQFVNGNPRIRQDFIEALEEGFPSVRWRMEDSNGSRTPSIRISSDPEHRRAAREDFSSRLKRRLNELSLSLRGLARRLGVSVSTVHYWTTARTVPSGDLFGVLCRELDLGKEALIPAGIATAARNRPAPLSVWLQELGLMGKSAHEKRVPQPIFEIPRSRMALFLNRLFACDGSVYVQNDDQAAISYCSVSQGLARDIQHLLLRFGIMAKLRRRQVKYREDYRVVYELRITHQAHLRRFLEEIGIHGKQAAVEKALAVSRSKSSKVILDVLPMEVWSLIEQRKGGMSWVELARRMGRGSGHNFHVGKRGIGRQLMGEFATALQDPELKALAESDLYWDRIESIEYLGKQQVYDLSVPDTHNFVAEDVLVHNTTFAMNIAENVAIKSEQPVAVFSMEMPGEALTMRMMSSLGRIDGHRIRTGKLEDDEWPRLTSAINILSQAKLFIDDTPALSPTDLRARARRLMREQGQLGLIVIDYLQLMQAPGAAENRTNEISMISRSLKALAKELEVPVIALSQLNRNLEQRPNKRPVMSDLRESGSIEQDADLVVFIYRDEVYNEESTDKGMAEIIIGKQRNGPIGTVRLTFLGQYTKFENYINEVYGDLH